MDLILHIDRENYPREKRWRTFEELVEDIGPLAGTQLAVPGGYEDDESEGGHLATVDAQSERATREAKMLAKGHRPVSDEEEQRTFDATIHALEWDPDRNGGGEGEGG